jgi:hypothetical protein
MSKLEVLTYKEALEKCLELDHKMVCEFDVGLHVLGMLTWEKEEYAFWPMEYNGQFVSIK